MTMLKSPILFKITLHQTEFSWKGTIGTDLRLFFNKLTLKLWVFITCLSFRLMIWNLKSDAEDYLDLQPTASASGKKRRFKDKFLKYGTETCFQCLECDRLFHNKASLYSHWNTVHIQFGKLYKKSEDWPKRVREIDRETYEKLNQLSQRRLEANKCLSGEVVEETLPRNRFFNNWIIII